MPFFELAVIALAGLIGGAYGTLVGAGNMLAMPLLLHLGYPAYDTIAATKLGTLGITSSGYYKFRKKGLVNHKISFFLTIFTLAGSVIGTNLVLKMDESIVEKLVGIVIILMALMALIKRDAGLKTKVLRKRHYFAGAVLSFILGIYIGFIGLAAGTFLIYMGIFVFGQTLLQSSATIKIPGFISNLGSVVVLVLNGKMLWLIGIVLFISMAAGSYIGAHYSDKIGNVWLKRMFIATAAVMALTLLF